MHLPPYASQPPPLSKQANSLDTISHNRRYDILNIGSFTQVFGYLCCGNCDILLTHHIGVSIDEPATFAIEIYFESLRISRSMRRRTPFPSEFLPFFSRRCFRALSSVSVAIIILSSLARLYQIDSVRPEGFEPSLSEEKQILSLSCLPIPPRAHGTYSIIKDNSAICQ